MSTTDDQPTLTIRRNARGFAFHWPAMLYVVEYRAHGGWCRVAAFVYQGQADKARASIAARGYTARVRAEGQSPA